MTLLNHLITKLTPLDDITTTLASLSGLPEALEQVAVFRETMQTMQTRLANRPDPQTIAQIQQLPSAEFTKLQETVNEIRKVIDLPKEVGVGVGLDSGKVFGAITGLKRSLEEVKASINTNSAGVSGGSTSDVGGELKEMRDLVMEMKGEMSRIKDTLATVSLPPQLVTPAVDTETSNTLRAILEELKNRPAPEKITNGNTLTPIPTTTSHQAHTPTTGIRPSLEDGPQPISHDIGASPPRALGRPIRPTPWAQQDLSAQRILGNRIIQPDYREYQTDIFGPIDPIPTPTNQAPSKKRKTPPQTTLGSGLPIRNTRSRSQSGSQTSSRNTSTGSVANQSKPKSKSTNKSTNKSKTRNTSANSASNNPAKRPTPPSGSLEAKEEGLKGLGLVYTTRSEATRARAVGLDIITIDSSESSGKKGDSGGAAGRIAPATSNTGDTTWPLGLNTDIETQPLDIESQALPDTQDLGQGQSHPQTQKQDRIPSPEPSQDQDQTQTQLNDSQIYSTFEFGYGQLPSVPSLPQYASFETDTQVNTYIPPPATSQEVVTSTELVEDSLALPPKKRAEPAYRKYQSPKTYGGNSKMHGFLKGNFGLLEDSDEEDG
jgi:hypothetical protein